MRFSVNREVSTMKTTITLELENDLVQSVKINGEEATEPSKRDIEQVFQYGSGVRYLSTIASSTDAKTARSCYWVWVYPPGVWVWRCS
jgi:hypothetical protein